MSEQRKCKGCGKPLTFAMGEGGKIIPLDRTAPTYELTRDLLGNEVAKRCGETVMVSHFSTCPKANDFSGGKAKGLRGRG